MRGVLLLDLRQFFIGARGENFARQQAFPHGWNPMVIKQPRDFCGAFHVLYACGAGGERVKVGFVGESSGYDGAETTG